ncbi:MAG: YceI family protein [Cyclobacteriaceae bacterium]|nr:YceI family protein [Cyclobacteriaceae bacterium]
MNKAISRTAKIAFIALFFSFTTTKVSAPTWTIDTSHSKISFEVNHFFTPVEGFFSNYSGELKFDKNNLEGSLVSFTVQVASVKTDSEKRDKHLQSADFFNAKKFPEMKFLSTSIAKTDEGYVAKGNLTIRDVTKSVEVPFKVLGRGPHPMKKGTEIIALKAGLKINRNDYGVGTGSWAATAVVGDEVTIKVVIEGYRGL